MYGNYSNCQFGANVTVQSFNYLVLDLQKCNTTYRVDSTLTPPIYVIVSLNCTGPGNSTKCDGLKNVSLNGITLLLIALISYNYSKF